MSWIKDLYTQAYNLIDSPERLRRSAKIAAAFSVSVAFILLVVAVASSMADVKQDDRAFDAVIFMRVAIVKLAAVIIVWVLALFAGYTSWSWLDNKAGKALFVWDEEDSESVKAARKLASALVLVGMVVGFAVIASGILK
jgi:succinate dehydrogenase/fumarate reductase cytochrome b subunit